MTQPPEFTSGGMMQGPELAAEAASMQAHYAANLAKVKADEAAGLVATIGQGLTNEELWGPWSLRLDPRGAGPKGGRGQTEESPAQMIDPWR